MQLDDYTNVDLIAFFGKSVFLKGRRTWMCVFFEKMYFKIEGKDKKNLKDKEILPFIEGKG